MKIDKCKERSLAILRNTDIQYAILDSSSGHCRAGDYDFWLSTQTFYNRETRQKGQGLMSLLNILKGHDSRFCELHDDESCFGEVIECKKCKFHISY